MRRLGMVFGCSCVLVLAGCGEVATEGATPDKPEDMAWQAVQGWEQLRLATPVESAHPYANNQSGGEPTLVRAPAGASALRVWFSKLEVERGYDSVQVFDDAGNLIQTITGRYEGWSETILGNTAHLAIVSDYSVTGFGYRVPAIQYRVDPTEGEWVTQVLGEREAIHTAHPYADGTRQKWTLRGEAGAERVRVRFERFETERGYDFVYLYDGEGRQVATYTGSLGSFTSAEVPGSVVTVELVTDYSIRRRGFDVVKLESLVSLAGCRGDADCAEDQHCEQVQCIRAPCPAQCVPDVRSCDDDSACDEGEACAQEVICPECVYADPPCRVACQVVGTCEPAPTEVACGARLGNTCGEDEYCHYEIGGICGWADATGVCRPTPEICTREYNPVCGCDGQTYSNACSANAAGTSAQREGACEPTTGQTCGTRGASPCPEGTFCQFSEAASCGALDHGGSCQPVPEVCTREYNPVCGCDGRTYSNPCAASQHGISVSASGACDAQPACAVGGCSGQLCGEEGDDLISTCEWHESYACYRQATCERQDDGQCGWTIDEAAQACFEANGR